MRFYTHFMGGIFAALLTMQFIRVDEPVFFVAVAAFFSLVPDIDETRSFIGQRFRITSFFVKLLFGHRRLLHSVWAAAGFAFLVSLFSVELGIAAFVGYTSHIILDSLTPAGIMPFFPVIWWRVSSFFQTGSVIEMVVFVLLLIGSVYFVDVGFGLL